MSEWLVYYGLEPFGAERDNAHAGMITAMIANVYRDPEKRAEPFEPGDFMLVVEAAEEPAPRQDWRAQLTMVEMFNAAFGGRDLRQK